MKTKILLTILMSLMLVLTGCSSGSSNNTEQPPAEELPVFTVVQLAEYDGKDGRSAYVAINGVVYDVTNVGAWGQGSHNGLTAGKVLTDDIKNSPHGTSVLGNLPIVGKME